MPRTPGSLALITAALLLSPAAALAAAATAQPAASSPSPAAPGRLSLKTDRAVIFKDGHALIVKTATATADPTGRVFTHDVPDSAVLGSFWATSERTPVRSMRAEWVESTSTDSQRTPCITTLELLRANIGRDVTLHMNWPAAQGPATYTGNLESVLDLPPDRAPATILPAIQPPPPSNPHNHWQPQPEPQPVVTTAALDLAPRGGQLLCLRTRDPAVGTIILPADEVRSISGSDLVTEMDRARRTDTRAKQLTLDLGPAAAGKPVSLTIMYFTPGLRWIPTYRVSGPLESTADLSLQAELLNELEDLDGAAIDLVVGVPNFRFKEVISPLSLEFVLRNALVRAAPSLMGAQSQVANAYFSQRAGEWRHADVAAPGGAAPGADLPLDVAAAGEQDLYVYSLPPMTLKKGARATLPLWNATAPMKHLYTMDIKVVRSPRDQSRDYWAYDARVWSREAAQAARNNQSPLELAEHRVWHQLELTNESTTPWTTGPALMLRGMIPLAQDLLTYTPPKGCALLPVTVAMDVRGEYAEEEIERTPNALAWGGHNYARIRKRATVTLTNYRDAASPTRVSISLGGRAENASEDGAVVINDYHPDDWGYHDSWWYTRPSNHSDVSWDFTLAAGESRTLTVDFVYYMP